MDREAQTTALKSLRSDASLAFFSSSLRSPGLKTPDKDGAGLVCAWRRFLRARRIVFVEVRVGVYCWKAHPDGAANTVQVLTTGSCMRGSVAPFIIAVLVIAAKTPVHAPVVNPLRRKHR